MRVVLSALASQDEDDLLYHTILQFGDIQAERHARGLSRCLDQIGQFPMAVRVRKVPGRDGVRARVYKSHLIIYRIDGETVQVLRIIDARRDWVRLLEP